MNPSFPSQSPSHHVFPAFDPGLPSPVQPVVPVAPATSLTQVASSATDLQSASGTPLQDRVAVIFLNRHGHLQSVESDSDTEAPEYHDEDELPAFAPHRAQAGANILESAMPVPEVLAAPPAPGAGAPDGMPPAQVDAPPLSHDAAPAEAFEEESGESVESGGVFVDVDTDSDDDHLAPQTAELEQPIVPAPDYLESKAFGDEARGSSRRE